MDGIQVTALDDAVDESGESLFVWFGDLPDRVSAGASTATTPAACPQPKPRTSTTVNNTHATRLRLTTNSLRETR